MSEMEYEIYMKPIVAASQESLILAGKQLIESHVYTMCGVVNVDEPKEVVIYIKGMTAEELADFQESEGTAPIRLPRYKEDGSRSKRDFNGFTYKGEVFATSRALQTVRIRAIKNDGESVISTYWRSISILGEQREGLILTNRTGDIMKENTRKRSTEENYTAGDRLMKFSAKLNGKPGVAVMDLGSKMCIVERRWLKHLQEGRDFKYIKDIELRTPENYPLPTEGTIRVFAPAGLELAKGMKRSGFEACVVDNQWNKTWDMMVGMNFRGISTIRVPINSLFNGEVEKPVNYKLWEYLEKGEGEETPRKERRKTFIMDTSRLRKVSGSKDKMWDSKDGKVINIRLPCGYHKPLGMTPEECLESPRHCYECSRPNKMAPPVRECKGRHQYRPPTPKKRTPPSSNNGDKEEEAFERRRVKTENKRDGYTGTRETTEILGVECTIQKRKTTPPRDERPVREETNKAETKSPPQLHTEDEPEDGIVAVQKSAKPEEPGVESTPKSYGIIEEIELASMEQIEFDERIEKAKKAREPQREPELNQKEAEDELKEKEFQEDRERLVIIQARRKKETLLKEREQEQAQDALAAQIHEEFEQRNAEYLEAKAAAKLKEAKKLEEEPENQEEAKAGATEKQDSM